MNDSLRDVIAGQLHRCLRIAQPRLGHGLIGSRHQRCPSCFERLNCQRGGLQAVAGGVHIDAGGGLFFRQSSQRIVLLLLVFLLRAQPCQIAFDTGEFDMLSARANGGQIGRA